MKFIKSFKIATASLLLFAATLTPIAMPQLVSASSAARDALCGGIGAISGAEDGEGCDDVDGEATVDSTIATVINIISLIAAVIAVIMIIIGGIRYITSNGDSGSTSGAKNTVIYAVVGLVIIALAQLIVQFVVQRLN